MRKRKPALEVLAGGMIAGGALGVLIFGGLSCKEASEVRRHLIKDDLTTAKKAFERQKDYVLGALGGTVIAVGGMMVNTYAAGKKKKE